MNYEKSHNLLLHTIHYSLKKLNELWLKEQEFNFEADRKYAELVKHCLDNPEEKPAPLYENFIYSDYNEEFAQSIKQLIEERHELLDLLYPSLSIARVNFPIFKYLFDWIEQSKPDGSMNPESCWCLGCKQNRLILFEERPSLGIAPAIVPLNFHGFNIPPSDFKLAKDMPTLEEENEQKKKDAFQKYLHDEVCSLAGNPCCKPCKDKHREDNQIIKKMMNWSNDLFNSDKVAFIYKELCDGYQAGDVKLVYHEDKDWRDRSPDLHDKYLFPETLTHANFDEVIAKHTPLAKEWFERCKNENLERNAQPKP
jgi:hypothetical protein